MSFYFVVNPIYNVSALFANREVVPVIICRTQEKFPLPLVLVAHNPALFFEVVNYTEQYHGLLARAKFTSQLHVQAKISINRKVNGCETTASRASEEFRLHRPTECCLVQEQ